MPDSMAGPVSAEAADPAARMRAALTSLLRVIAACRTAADAAARAIAALAVAAPGDAKVRGEGGSGARRAPHLRRGRWPCSTPAAPELPRRWCPSCASAWLPCKM